MSALRKFEERALHSALEGLNPSCSLAFLLASANRQLNSLEFLSLGVACVVDMSLRRVLEQAWSMSSLDGIDEAVWTSNLDTVMAAMPDEGASSWGRIDVMAEHVGAAIAYSARYLLSRDLNEILWGVRRAYEAADQASIWLLGIQSGTPTAETSILRHPVVQNELGRQARDLDLLRSDNVEAVRDFARTEKLLDGSYATQIF